MWVPPYDEDGRARALRVARHEAGHYVTARVLGFRAGPCSIRIDFPIDHRGGAGVELATALTSVDDVADYLERRVQVLYAGTLAEAMSEGVIDQPKAIEYLKTGSARDHAKVRELINILRNIKYPETQALERTQKELTDLDLTLLGKTEAIVLAEGKIIHKLANHLASGIRAYGQDFELSVEALNNFRPLVKRFGRP